MLENIAAQLDMHPKALMRRLKQEGTSHSDLLDSLRREHHRCGVVQRARTTARDADDHEDEGERGEADRKTTGHEADGTGAASAGAISVISASSPSISAVALVVVTGTTIASASTVDRGASRFKRAS